jgi:D-alanine-D-alanine ligase
MLLQEPLADRELPGVLTNQEPSGLLPIQTSRELMPDLDAEFDEPETIQAIAKAIENAGHKVRVIEADQDLPLRLAQDRPDIVFNIAEGLNGRGREAQVPAILSYLGIPYVGSDETTMALTMDKALCKRLLSTYAIPTPRYQLVSRATDFVDESLGWPLIIKPNAEGSSKGISDMSIVDDHASLRQLLSEKLALYQQQMLVEQYITGREFTVGILGNGNDRRVFTPMEVIFADPHHQIYSFEVKRDYRRLIEYACPPDLTAAKLSEIEETASAIYSILECRDFARIDFRMDKSGQLYFIEINPLPGLAPNYSDYPMLAEFCGVDYEALIQAVLAAALSRYQLN